MFRDVVHEQIVDHERRGLETPAGVLAHALSREVLIAQGSQRLGGTPHSLAEVGRSSGLIIAASTIGSIAGVFVAGFVLIDHMKVSNIFRLMGGLTILLGFLCVPCDRWLAVGSKSFNPTPPK